MSEQETRTTTTREISNVGMLDLTTIQSADDLAGIERIHNVGLILVPEHLAHLVARVPMKNVGSVLPVPAGKKVRIISGNMKMTGDALANPGGDDETLVIAGMLHITTPVERVAYKQLIVAGMVLAPVGSEGALGAGMTRLSGSVVYYQGNPRVFSGRERLGREFFEYLEPDQTLVFSGHITIEDDVSPELLRQKVTSIVLAGKLDAPRPLIPLLQFLAVEKSGVIEPSDESDD